MNLKINTGSAVIDDLLEGGYEKDILSTIYGPPGSGKTTLCLLASIAQARAGAKVIYIDSEGGFSTERVNQLCGDDAQDVLSRIVLLRPTSFDEQNKNLERLKSLVSSHIGLIVMDTLTIFYRLELSKNEDVKLTNNKLIWQVSYLNEIARKHNIPVLITNQVYADFNNKDEVRMVGGDIIRYSSKCLINLKNLGENKRRATIMNHRSIAEGKEVDFAIINEGFV